jgi:predicted RNA binding protein YcfA (HicA-like mRNA interferase family)
VTKRSGSHVVLERPGYANYVWAFHDGEEIGPPMMARIGKKTGLTPEDV